MKNQAIVSLKALAAFSLLAGVLYPLLITGIAQLAFRDKANGSIIYQNGVAVGSTLIGQTFSADSYFWSRPSSIGYDAAHSGASNLGPTSAKLVSLANARAQQFAAANGIQSPAAVPAEMVFASGSGLDPHISRDAALLQLDRVANARRFDAHQKELVRQLILKNAADNRFEGLGKPFVNVLILNLDINKL